MSPVFKKRTNGETIGRVSCPPSNSIEATLRPRIILDYVLAHAKDDERPYLNVLIFGVPLLGLLDSGASRTIIGDNGWKVLKSLCQLTPGISECTVANGETCQVIGFVRLPIQLRERIVIIEALVVPSLSHSLILGIDFWSRMGIVPDLHAGEWTFRNTQESFPKVSAIQSRGSLSLDQEKLLDDLIQNTFSNMDGLGCTNLVELSIKTDSPPIKQRYYPLSRALQTEVNAELEKMLADGIVEPSDSPWSSPIVMIKKKTGGWRFCVDYRSLNRVTVPDSYPIPYVSATLDKLRDAKYLSTLDIKSAYWQIPISEQSKPLTAFTVPTRGLFQFKRMPFGLTNAPAIWQRLIDRVIGVEMESSVFVYLDDVIICTSTFEEHIRILREVINRLTRAGLTLNKEKCIFCKPELKYLGYVVNSSGLLVDPEKIEAILNIPIPKSVTEIRRIIGLASWYRRFVPNFSTLIAPLSALTRKNVKFHWDEKCEAAFRSIKEHLIQAPVLSCPDFDKPFTLQCDASDFGLGAVLTQMHGDAEHVICYLSRSLTKNERKYSTTEKECLAVLFAIEKLRCYIEGTKFTVITDHYSLKWLNSIKDPVGRIARWAVRLQQYDFVIIHRKGKEHIVPDTLSRSVPAVDSVEDTSTSPRIVDTDLALSIQDKWYVQMMKRISDSPSKYPMWWIDKNKLFKRTKQTSYPGLSNGDSPWRLVVPKEKRSEIIRSHHDPPTCGHLGVSRTLSRISQRYYWPMMKNDVAKFIKRCFVCLGTKPLQQAPPGQMLSQQPTAIKPWQVISVDIVGPLPRSTSGFSYIFSVCDVFSKFCLFFPLRSATAASIVKWLEDHVILIYGVPKKIIADNGPQFRSSIFRDTVTGYGIELRYTANYHPQANPVERVHRVLKTILTSYVNKDHRQWERFLAKAGCAIRSAKHEVTGFTPNFIVFGHEIVLPHDSDTSPPLPDNRFDPLERSRGLAQLFTDIHKRLTQAYQKSRNMYNLRRRDERFAVDQQVWKKNYHLSDAAKGFTSKLAPKFSGPFLVSRALSPWTYELKDLNGRIIGNWHAKDLKAHPPDDDAIK